MKISPGVGDGATSIREGEVKDALDMLGFIKPNHEVREMLADLKKRNKLGSDGMIPQSVFKEVKIVWTSVALLYFCLIF